MLNTITSVRHLPVFYLNSKKLSKPTTVSKLASKIMLGILSLAFFSAYQPVLSIPPLKPNIVHAQAEQSHSVSSQETPFTFQLPHPGYLSTKYSSFHPGVDIATGLGMPIKPITGGIVIEEGYNFWGLGLTITIDHGQGFKSTYAHLGKIYVQKGQQVDINSTIGTVGLTGNTSGPHTHLEIIKEDKTLDPIALLPKMRDYPIEQDFIAITTDSATNKKAELPKTTNTIPNPQDQSIISIVPKNEAKAPTSLPINLKENISLTIPQPINFN